MQLRTHIAGQFLTDAKMTDEILRTVFPKDVEYLKNTYVESKEEAIRTSNSDEAVRVSRLYQLSAIPIATNGIPHTAYYVTDTVMNDLVHIKVKRGTDGHFDWSLFKSIPECKKTFIFNGDWLLRVWFVDGVIFMLQVENKKHPKLCHLWVDRIEHDHSPLFDREDMQIVEEQFYKLLCFFYFSENEERIVNAGKSYGTKKQADALDNSTNIPVIIVNSNWNITSIRTEGFAVAGHLRLQPCGPGNKDRKLIFIDPYSKNGYVRKASKPE